MSFHSLISGKITLNQYAIRLANHGAVFHIHYWGVTPKHYNNLPHQHSFFEICYMVDGIGRYIENGQTYHLKESTLFLSKPGVQHQIKSLTGMFLLYIGFECIESESSEEWIQFMEQVKSCSKVLQPVTSDCIAASLWKSLLIQATKPKQPFFEELLTHLAYSLIVSLLQTFVPTSSNEVEQKISRSASPLLKQATLYIKDNLSQPLKLSDLADYLHVSERHLSRIFVSELGINYSKFVQKERIKRGVTLLKSTNRSIKEIAEATGFSTVHYFTRVFTSIMGISPGRFRVLYTDETTTNI